MKMLLVTMFLLLVMSGAAQAQTASTDDWNNLRLLFTGEKVTVVRMSLKTHQGIFLSYSEDDLTLRVDWREMIVPRTEVFRVTSREEDHRKRNKFIGALVGLGAGIAVGALMDAQRVPESGEEHLLTSYMGLIGLGVGSGVGALFPGHPTIYRATNTPGTSGNPASHNKPPPSKHPNEQTVQSKKKPAQSSRLKLPNYFLNTEALSLRGTR
jgi:hypothetical protein